MELRVDTSEPVDPFMSKFEFPRRRETAVCEEGTCEQIETVGGCDSSIDGQRRQQQREDDFVRQQSRKRRRERDEETSVAEDDY